MYALRQSIDWIGTSHGSTAAIEAIELQDVCKDSASYRPEIISILQTSRARLALDLLPGVSKKLRSQPAIVSFRTDRPASGAYCTLVELWAPRSDVARRGPDERAVMGNLRSSVPATDLIRLAVHCCAYAARSYGHRVRSSLAGMRAGCAWTWSTVSRHGAPSVQTAQVPAEAASLRHLAGRTLVPCLPSASPAPAASFARTSSA